MVFDQTVTKYLEVELDFSFIASIAGDTGLEFVDSPRPEARCDSELVTVEAPEWFWCHTEGDKNVKIPEKEACP